MLLISIVKWDSSSWLSQGMKTLLWKKQTWENMCQSIPPSGAGGEEESAGHDPVHEAREARQGEPRHGGSPEQARHGAERRQPGDRDAQEVGERVLRRPRDIGLTTRAGR